MFVGYLDADEKNIDFYIRGDLSLITINGKFIKLANDNDILSGVD